MIKRIDIALSGPMCSCEASQKSAGSYHFTVEHGHITLTCNTCGSSVRTPTNQIVFNFVPSRVTT